MIQIEDTATEKVENEDDDGLVDWLPAVKSLVPRGPDPSNSDRVSGEGEGGKNVHNGVVPERVNGRLLGQSDGGDEGDDYGGDCRGLELQGLTNGNIRGGGGSERW